MKKPRPLTPEETIVFNRHYKDCYELIYNIALSRVGDENIAEVVAQETFVTAWKRYDQFMGSENPAGWLVVVAKNKSKQALRDRRIHLDHRISEKDVEEIPVEYNFDRIVPLIPDSEEKRLLTRFYEEGYSLQEMAAEQNISLSAMKMRMKRARDKLKEKYLQNFSQNM